MPKKKKITSKPKKTKKKKSTHGPRKSKGEKKKKRCRVMCFGIVNHAKLCVFFKKIFLLSCDVS